MTGTADFVQDAVNAYLAVCDNEAEKLPGTVPEIRCLNDCNNHGKFTASPARLADAEFFYVCTSQGSTTNGFYLK